MCIVGKLKKTCLDENKTKRLWMNVTLDSRKYDNCAMED